MVTASPINLNNLFLEGNMTLNPDLAYVITISNNSKVNLLTSQLQGELSKLYGKPVEEISINPFVSNSRNYGVVNSELSNLMAEGTAQSSDIVHCPIDQFNQEISDSVGIQELVAYLADTQGEVFVNTYKNTSDLSLPSSATVLAPRGDLVTTIDDKVWQHENIISKLGIPVPRKFVAESREELIDLYKTQFNSGNAFVMNPYSSSGSGTQAVTSLHELETSPKIKKADTYLISDLLDVQNSPSVLAVIDDSRVVTVGLSDQILDGVTYLGNYSPSTATEKQVEEILEMTQEIGRELQSVGYRGPFGLDFMIDENAKTYFTEINPRIIGATNDLNSALLSSNPNHPSIPVMIYNAITKGNIYADGKTPLTLPKETWFSRAIKVKAGERLFINKDTPMDTRLSVTERYNQGTLFHSPRVGGKVTFRSPEPVNMGYISGLVDAFEANNVSKISEY